jgi:leucyl-tRNA synthetase
MLAKFGADSARMYSLFAAPPERDLDWQEDGVSGINRFLARLYRFVTRNAGRDSAGQAVDGDRQARRKLHQTIQKISIDFDGRWHFNTSIAALMELVNELHKLEAQLSVGCVHEVCERITLLLAPFAPYTAQELWTELGKSGAVFRQPWPGYDTELAKDDLIEIPVQVNGKVRGHIFVALGTGKEDLEKLALENEKVKPFVDGKQIVKVVVVLDRLVSIVVK